MHLDDNILQSKTVCKIVDVLKDARTITKTGSNQCKKINKDIEIIVQAHEKAVKRTKSFRTKMEKSNITKEYIPKATKRHYSIRWSH